MSTVILDCTIRDGGHLNKWRFTPQCVKASYFAALKSGADYFEIGYRCPPTAQGLGPFGYCDDEYLFSLFPASDRCKLTVMMDTGKSETSLFKACTPENTPVRAVRVAAYPHELEKAIVQAGELKAKGYEVFMNLMASSELGESHFALLRDWKDKDILEAIYFADSFGAFIPSDIPGHVETLRGLGFTRIGFHPHNNLQMSFANTLRAIEEGVTYVDASIFGMGRGSGNLPIEVLVGFLEKQGHAHYNTVAYLDVIERFYLDLFKELNWGYKIQSLMGGLKNIHPYYVDDLFNRKNYTVDEIWNALDSVREQCPVSYSVDKLNDALESRFYTPLSQEHVGEIFKRIGDRYEIIPAPDAFRAGAFAGTGRHAGRKAVVVANGPSVVQEREAIERFVRETGAVTVGVNYLPEGFVPDYHLFVNRKRFLKFVSKVAPGSTLVVPSYFGKEFVRENWPGDCLWLDIDTVADPSVPPVEVSTQRPVNLNVAVSAILMAWQMGASEIFVAGMDGYVSEMNREMAYFYNENDVPYDKEVASLRYAMLAAELERLNHFLQEHSVPFSIVTPTSHKKYFRKVY
jgi:4-hydroxy 2-oxovalerate aldolase